MAVPTITALSVTVGPTQGRTLVAITGTNFREYPPPPASGPVPVPDPPVEVLFGGLAASEVQVESTTKVWCLTPVNDPGAVDVTVTNLDDDGVAIAGETVTAAAAFTYTRPYLRAPQHGDLKRLVGQVVVEWRRQVIENTKLKKEHSDFSSTPASGRTALSRLPGAVLWGPTLRRNRFLTVQAYQPTEISATQFKARRPTEARDLVFNFTLFSDSSTELLNMIEVVDHFFDKNTTISMLRDPANPGLGKIEYELLYDSPAGLDDDINQSNVGTATGSFYIRGFEMQQTAGFTDDGIEHVGDVVRTVDYTQAQKEDEDE